MPSAPEPVRIVFAEEDTLFTLMEATLLRRLTPGAEKAMTYFFGPEFQRPLADLLHIADRLGLPADIDVVICPDDATLRRVLPTADFLVTERHPITREHISAGPRLRLIQKFGRDTENIDVKAAREAGIPVAKLVRYSSLSSADNITALILALARNLLQAHRSVVARRDPSRPARFIDDPPRTKFNWANIRNLRVMAEQTVGFVGFGENSGEVSKRLCRMGTRVFYYKRHPFPPGVEEELGATYRPLDELLAVSDFVSINVPWNESTEKMVDAAFLAKMKRGAYLVNASRGGVVDERALYDALKSGHLAGAALDVYRYEPVPPDCPLLDLDNILWTPHMSGGEPEFMFREVEDVLANVARVLRGEPAKDLVTA